MIFFGLLFLLVLLFMSLCFVLIFLGKLINYIL